MEKETKTQKQRVNEKYAKLVSYNAELLALCMQTVEANDVLSKHDAMARRTMATTLFIRSCARMDKADNDKAADKLMEISKSKVA